MAHDKSRSRRKSKIRDRSADKGKRWIYGTHTVEAALANPVRKLDRLLLTPAAEARQGNKLAQATVKDRVFKEIVRPADISDLLPAGAVHQGIALQTSPLPNPDIRLACQPSSKKRSLTVVLDQVTDPRNLGAVLRSAAVFGVKSVIIQDRGSPQESGELAKAASGGLDRVPLVRAVNLSRALDTLADLGYWRVALDVMAEQPLDGSGDETAVALVLGSEGKGLRRLTVKHCDAVAKLPVKDNGSKSLNVSVAAAIALYEFVRCDNHGLET